MARVGIKGLAAGILTCCASTSMASFHVMQVEQIIGGIGGDTTAQAIQLRMRSGGQNLVSNGRIKVFNAAGANAVIVVDMVTNVTNGTAGDRVLVTSSAFNAYTSPTCVSNFTMTNLIPASYLNAGSLTFEDDFGTVYWRVSWGGAGYTGTNSGSSTNDADGNFGPPFGSACPSTTNVALRFPGTAAAPSTTNLADYALGTSAASVTNNARTSFTVTVGACCLSTGQCAGFQRQAACIANGGTYQGNNTLCANVNCQPSAGACCLPAGNCVLAADNGACTAQNGTFQGLGSACATANCPQPSGACCFIDGSCSSLISADCNGGGGAFQGAFSVCASVACDVTGGACCEGAGACSLKTDSQCNRDGGNYLGDGSHCTPNECNIEPTGACCAPAGGCALATSAACGAQGGVYGGDGSSCGTVLCICKRGDANCDGAINNFDIDFFVAAVIGDQGAYTALGGQAVCWDQRSCWGDLGCDQLFNNFDIDPFVACILALPPTGQACPCN